MADSDSESVELDQGGELDQDGGGSDWSDDDASDEEDVSEKPLGAGGAAVATGCATGCAAQEGALSAAAAVGPT